jgi:preprotein translocase subunit SecB
MKPKISPEEYRRILESLELSSLYITDSSSKLREEFFSNTLKVDIEEKSNFKQDSNILTVTYAYKLIAKSAELTDPAITINVHYAVKYQITKDIIITKEFMKVFSELTISMLLWTYFREFVNNTVYRMGMPPLVLGLKKR